MALSWQFDVGLGVSSLGNVDGAHGISVVFQVSVSADGRWQRTSVFRNADGSRQHTLLCKNKVTKNDGNSNETQIQTKTEENTQLVRTPTQEGPLRVPRAGSIPCVFAFVFV